MPDDGTLIIPPGVTAPGHFRLSAAPHPFKTKTVDLEIPEGCTILEMLQIAQPDPFLLKHAHVFVEDTYVPREYWTRLRPKAGVNVTARVVPSDMRGGGGGSSGGSKSVLSIVLMIVVIAAVVVFQQYELLPALTAIGITGSTALLVSAAVGIALTAVGSMLVNAIAGPRAPNAAALTPSVGAATSAQESPSYDIEAARNSVNHFGIVPRILGKSRMIPPLGALSYTEVVGDDTYLRMMVTWGYGPVTITDLEIGQTALTSFSDIELEHRYGYPTDTPMTLFPESAFEESLSIDLLQTDPPTVRTTQEDTDEISLDITFPQGLVSFSPTDGSKNPRSVSIDIYYRPVGTSAWTFQSTLTATEAKSVGFRRGVRWTVPNGQYDVQLQRTSPNATLTTDYDGTTWTVLRSFTVQDPIAMPGLAKTALRIKATGQLNSTIDQLSAIITSVLPDWDSNQQLWVARETSNPAACYRAILQGAGNARPVDDTRVDLEGLQEWAEECAANNREYNQVRDFQSSVWSALGDVAAAGRASPSLRDGLWGVVMDRPRTSHVQHWTPRNSWNFTMTRTFVDQPHGFRARFIDRTQDWVQNELIIYDDGYDVNNATKFEQIEFPGVTDPNQVWKDGRYHIAVSRLRSIIYTLQVDFEHIICTRGDWVKITHDVINAGIASGRITELVTDDDGNVTEIHVDEPLLMEVGVEYGLSVRSTENVAQAIPLLNSGGQTTVLRPLVPIVAAMAPDDNALFGFGTLGQETIDALMLTIKPADDMVAEITCIDYAPAVFTAETSTIPQFANPPVGTLGLLMPIILDIQSDDHVAITLASGVLQPIIVVTYGYVSQRSSSVTGLELQYREVGTDSWTSVTGDYDARSLSINPVTQGHTYELRSRFIRGTATGPWTATIQHTVVGLSRPPDAIPWIDVVYQDAMSQLNWGRVVDVRNIDYEIRYGNVFESAQVVGRTAEAKYSLVTGNGIYWVAAHTSQFGQDIYGTPAHIELAGATLERNVAATYDEAALGWPGSLTGSIAIINGKLETTGGGDWLGYPDILTVPDFLHSDYSGHILALDDITFLTDLQGNRLLFSDAAPAVVGTYTPAESVNTGRVQSSLVSVTFNAYGVSLVDDTVVDASKITTEIQIRTAVADAVWGDWRTYLPGYYNAQFFQVRALINTLDETVAAVLDSFVWSIDMPDRVDVYQDVDCPIGGVQIVFQPVGAALPAPFNGGPGGFPGSPGLPAVHVTYENKAGDEFVVLETTLDHCRIAVKNSGIFVARTLKTVNVQGF